jgi:hypothetical protein
MNVDNNNDKVNKKNIFCIYCNEKFTDINNLFNHIYKCKENIYINLKNNELEMQSKLILDLRKSKTREINKLQIFIEKLELRVLELTNQLDEINKEKDMKTVKFEEAILDRSVQMESALKDKVSVLEKIITVNQTIGMQSTSSYKQICAKYTDAPPMIEMDKETIAGLLENIYINASAPPNMTPEEKEMYIRKSIVSSHKNDRLVSELTQIIIIHAKKDEPEKQSVWATDTSRVTFVIRELLNEIPTWMVDKQGIKMVKYTVKPVMIYIRHQLIEYEKSLRKEMCKDETLFIKLCEALCDCMNVISDVDCGKIEKAITEKMVGFFNFDKDMNIKGKQHEGKMLLMNKKDEDEILMIVDKKKNKKYVDKKNKIHNKK